MLHVSWFSPPSCWENDRSGGGILTLLGSGFPTNKRQIGTALTSSPGALQRVGPMTCVGLSTLRMGDSAILLHD